MKDKNNLEQLHADKLGNREIMPSEQAWERIARNRQQGKDKKKKKRAYLYYAASVAVIMFFAGYSFFAGNADVGNEPQVVNSEAKEIKDKDNVSSPVTVGQTVLQAHQEIVTYDNAEKNDDLPTANKEKVEVISGALQQVQANEGLAGISATSMPDVKAVTRDKLYDEEVDYLLKNAVKEIAADKHLSKPTNDAALLKEVETEMDEYYREKAMSIFSLKNKKIRFAIKN